MIRLMISWRRVSQTLVKLVSSFKRISTPAMKLMRDVTIKMKKFRFYQAMIQGTKKLLTENI